MNTDTGDVAAAAAEALRLVQARPHEARSMAVRARAGAMRAGDLASASMAARALGLVAKEQSDLTAATKHLTAAIRLGEKAGNPVRMAEACMSLSLVLANRGQVGGALRMLERAAPILAGLDSARLRTQRALVLQHQDRVEEALEDYRRALVTFRRAGDRLWQARALCNRGVLHTDLGHFRNAEADLRGALELWTVLDFDLGVGLARHQLGYLYARRGDVADALAWYDQAEESYAAAGVQRPTILFDRGELLLSVRLVAEARRAAERAVKQLAEGRMAMRLAEARLLLSQAAFCDGDLQTAQTAAEQARRAFVRQQRPAWAALARYAGLRASWAAGNRSGSTLASALRTAEALRSEGWAVAALDARVLAARMALELGRVDMARRELARASRARLRGPVDLRSRAWHAHALLWIARGDRRRAEAALCSGLSMLDEHRALLGATELRAYASGHGTELAMAGLRLAVEDSDPGRILEWAERWRAGSLRSRPARPPDDPRLAAELAKLRQVVRRRERAALKGNDVRPLLREQASIEEMVRRRTRRALRTETGPFAVLPNAAALAATLGDRALVELVELDGRLYAVVVTVDGTCLRPLGPAAEVDWELQALHFALRRLARVGASTAAALFSVAHCVKRLDALLFEPLAADVADRALVVVPTGSLHAMPWSLLPSCRGRAITVTPSAALWHSAMLGARARADMVSRVVLVAGPGLPHAAAEVAALGRRYRGSARLAGPQATVKSVLGALDGADLAHVAAHGSFRADNPLFSCLELADGPLMVYDLESLHRAPGVLVLSACESGLTGIQPGNELMGLVASVLALGTTTLVASVVAVPDEATAHLMLAVHRHLRAGSSPALALCRAQAESADGDPQATAASAAFVCFGAG